MSEFVSAGNSVEVTFKSDVSSGGRGFKIIYGITTGIGSTPDLHKLLDFQNAQLLLELITFQNWQLELELDIFQLITFRKWQLDLELKLLTIRNPQQGLEIHCSKNESTN